MIRGCKPAGSTLYDEDVSSRTNIQAVAESDEPDGSSTAVLYRATKQVGSETALHARISALSICEALYRPYRSVPMTRAVKARVRRTSRGDLRRPPEMAPES